MSTETAADRRSEIAGIRRAGCQAAGPRTPGTGRCRRWTGTDNRSCRRRCGSPPRPRPHRRWRPVKRLAVSVSAGPAPDRACAAAGQDGRGVCGGVWLGEGRQRERSVGCSPASAADVEADRGQQTTRPSADRRWTTAHGGLNLGCFAHPVDQGHGGGRRAHLALVDDVGEHVARRLGRKRAPCRRTGRSSGWPPARPGLEPGRPGVQRRGRIGGLQIVRALLQAGVDEVRRSRRRFRIGRVLGEDRRYRARAEGR
jgi:hypothetical protein